MPNVPNMGKVLKNARKGKNAPCKDCTERKQTCHKDCDRYAEYRRQLADVRAAIEAAYVPQVEAEDRLIKSILKFKRRGK